MNNDMEQVVIPYFEYSAINELIHAHLEEFGNALKAVIVFGPLVTTGNTFDIELLEVIQGWQGLPRYQADTTPELPLRGKLFLNLLSDTEFASFTRARLRGKTRLREQVLKGYEVVFEFPAGYARDILTEAKAQIKAQAGGEMLLNPLRIRSAQRDSSL